MARRTVKQLIEDGLLKNEEYSVLLENGITLTGYIVQERVDKTHDTEGYNVYDFRSGRDSTFDVQMFYATVEPNVMVDWADSIATKQTLDFGEDGFINVDDSDLDPDYVCEELVNDVYEFDKDEVCAAITRVYEKPSLFVSTEKWKDDPLDLGRFVSTFECDGHIIRTFHDEYGFIEFTEVDRHLKS